MCAVEKQILISVVLVAVVGQDRKWENEMMKRRGFLGNILAAIVAKPVLDTLPVAEPVALVVPTVIDIKPPVVVNDIPHWTQECTCGPVPIIDVFREFVPGLRPYCPVHTPLQYRQHYIKDEESRHFSEEERRLDAAIAAALAGPQEEEDFEYPDEYIDWRDDEGDD
jgi:hypothetical protein